LSIINVDMRNRLTQTAEEYFHYSRRESSNRLF
jgi:hypothetical protein